MNGHRIICKTQDVSRYVAFKRFDWIFYIDRLFYQK